MGLDDAGETRLSHLQRENILPFQSEIVHVGDRKAGAGDEYDEKFQTFFVVRSVARVERRPNDVRLVSAERDDRETRIERRHNGVAYTVERDRRENGSPFHGAVQGTPRRTHQRGNAVRVHIGMQRYEMAQSERRGTQADRQSRRHVLHTTGAFRTGHRIRIFRAQHVLDHIDQPVTKRDHIAGAADGTARSAGKLYGPHERYVEMEAAVSFARSSEKVRHSRVLRIGS